MAHPPATGSRSSRRRLAARVADTAGHGRRGRRRARRRSAATAPSRRRPASRATRAEPVVLVPRAAHPRQALLTAAARRRLAAALSGRQPRGGAGARAPSWSARRCSAGTTTSSTGAATRAHGRAASRSPTGCLDPGTVVVRARLRACCSSSRSASPTASPPALAYLASLAVGLLGNVLLRARAALLAALGGVATRSTRRSSSYGGWGGAGDRRPARGRDDGAGGARSASASTSCARCPAWSPTTRTASGTCRCGIALRIGAPRLLLARWTALVLVGAAPGRRAVGLSQ